jgi:fumarate hydratase, class I
MEAIYEFEVKDMPETVAVDSNGTSVHKTGPTEWQARIRKTPASLMNDRRTPSGPPAPSHGRKG